MKPFRTETDSMANIQCPPTRFTGAQTAPRLENFRSSSLGPAPRVVDCRPTRSGASPTWSNASAIAMLAPVIGYTTRQIAKSPAMAPGNPPKK